MPQDLGTYGRTDGRVQRYMPPTLWWHKKEQCRSLSAGTDVYDLSRVFLL
jgi:hypothetical protein